MPDYAPPLAQFLTLGDPDRRRHPPDYLRMGFGPEHIPELIRMATDRELNWADSDSLWVWAPVHAWRTLGQLRAAEAVGPLLQVLEDEEEEGGDYALDDLPTVFAEIGAPALPALETFLADPSRSVYSRMAVAEAIEQIAREHPETYPACVEILVRQLERPGNGERQVNGAVVSSLLNLEAVEAAPAIERAFAAGQVAESICGDWEEARYTLGLRPDPPAPRFYDHGFGLPLGALPPGSKSPRARAKERAKAKRKEARKARKRNRKK